MRIVMYTFEFLPFKGGIATYCHELACGLSTLGHTVTVVAPRSGNLNGEGLPYDVEWIGRNHGTFSSMVNGAVILRRVVARDVPDVVLVTQQYALIALAIFGGAMRSPTVPILHGSEILSQGAGGSLARRALAMFMKRFYDQCSRVICVSAYARELVVGTFGVRPGLAVVVHNGMRDRFDRDLDRGDEVRTRWGIGPHARVLLTLARLVPRKGQDTVIRALPKVIEKHPDVVYLCAGTGPYRDALVRLATEHGVQRHVVFAGGVEEREKYAYYDACDVFVMPSRQEGSSVEGFGLSFLEAWHAGKAVLGGAHGGVVEVIENGVDGVVVDPSRFEEVADAVLSLFARPCELREMGARGRVKARTRFTDTVMAEGVAAVLGPVVDGRDRRI